MPYAAFAVNPMASAYFRYVSTEATTILASIASSSIPTNETLTHASTTTPLSRIRSITSTRLDDPIVFYTIFLISYIKFVYTVLDIRGTAYLLC